MVDVAAVIGMPTTCLHHHVWFYRNGGESALVRKNTCPTIGPQHYSSELDDEIVAIGKRPEESGLDASAE